MVKLRKLSVNELNRKSANECKSAPKIPLVIVLDNVRSQNNIGSIFRTCDALGVESIIICGISATPPHPEIHKTALGAEDTVKWIYFENTTNAISFLADNKFEVLAVEQIENSLDIRKFHPNPSRKYAFVFGNELKGVAQEVLDRCDGALEIPQFGAKHSFNVAVTAGIVIWDFFSKLSLKI
jgi:tRNA G18 (ribose-2'-O)-methylase SpoU